MTGGCVVAADGVARECSLTGGRVVVAGGVRFEREIPGGGVIVSSSVAGERGKTGGGVGVAGAIIMEREGPQGRVHPATTQISEHVPSKARIKNLDACLWTLPIGQLRKAEPSGRNNDPIESNFHFEILLLPGWFQTAIFDHEQGTDALSGEKASPPDSDLDPAHCKAWDASLSILNFINETRRPPPGISRRRVSSSFSWAT